MDQMIIILISLSALVGHQMITSCSGLYCDTTLQERHRDGDMVMIDVKSLTTNTRRRRSDAVSDALLVSNAASNMLNRAARPEIRGEDSIDELTQRKVLLGQLHDYFSLQFFQEGQDQMVKEKARSVLEFLETRITQVGEHLQNYQLALYSQAISPGVKLKVSDLTLVHQLIEKSRRNSFEIPLLSQAADAFTGLVYFQFISMSQAEQVRMDNKKTLFELASGNEQKFGSLKKMESYKAGIENVTEELLKVMADTGVKLERDLDIMENLKNTANLVVRSLKDSKRFARYILETANAAGGELSKWSMIMGQKLKELEGTAVPAHTARAVMLSDAEVIIQMNVTETEEPLYLTKDLCVPGINITYDANGKPEFIGNEYVLEEALTKPHSKSYFWDFYLDCAIPIAEINRRRKIMRRSIKDSRFLFKEATREIPRVIRRIANRAKRCDNLYGDIIANAPHHCREEIKRINALHALEIQELQDEFREHIRNDHH